MRSNGELWGMFNLVATYRGHCRNGYEQVSTFLLVRCVKLPASPKELPNPHLWDPQEHGWVLHDGKLVLNWYKGDQVPVNVFNYIDDGCNGVQDDGDPDNVHCSSSDKPDTKNELL